MTDIFKEVEEDYHRERNMALVKRYAPYLIAAAVGLVLLTGGYEAYKAVRTQRMEKNAEAFASASDQMQKDPKAAAQAFSAIAQSGGGYGYLARFREAEALEASGDVGGAAKVLDQIAQDGAKDKVVADLALLKTGYLLLDRQGRADLEKRLAPLLTEGNPWRAEAREIVAFASLKSGEQQKALDAFKSLAKDPDNPASLRNRAKSMVAALGGSLAPAETGKPGMTAPPAAPKESQ